MMSLLFHLSDVHLTTPPGPQDVILERLVEAIRGEHEAAGSPPAALAITGDVFDSGDAGPPLVDTFLGLHDRILRVLGKSTPTLVLPGNHDRRRLGFVGPHRDEPFRHLARASKGRRMFIAGTSTPFLAELVPPELHGLPAHVIAYDSSYLPRGLLGAGGTIRVEDLLQVHAQLPSDGLPVLVLVHHHLIPTPVTDISGVDDKAAPRFARWFLRVAAPNLFSNADREELTMTALGAGTALSALHTFGRPVLLLHGHKHMPTARLVRGMTDGCGDVLLASAGTAAKRERVHSTRDPDAARLWPSFNTVVFDEGQVHIDAVAFSPKPNTRPPLRRVLARLSASGPKWEPKAVTFRVSDPSPRVQRDEASYLLSPSVAHAHRWDFSCERTIELVKGARLRRYVDFVHSLPSTASRGRGRRRTSRRVELSLNGTVHYAAREAICRTLAEGAIHYGIGTAFEWVGLLCRYGAVQATLRLSRQNAASVAPFASVTDLTTGRERPIRLVATAEQWTASAEDCAPRTMLRIYWPLARA